VLKVTGDRLFFTCSELILVRWISGGVQLTPAGVGIPNAHADWRAGHERLRELARAHGLNEGGR
jgi:hypothetical protein